MAKYYIKSESQQKLITIGYFLLLLITQFFINLMITNSVCGFSQYSVALYTTIIPWLFIFGLMYVFLMIFPSWLIPFSNTLGYGLCVMTGISALFKNIIKDRNALKVESSKAEFVKAIDNIYEDQSLLINQLTQDELPIWWKTMGEANILKSGVGGIDGEYYKKLMSFIAFKDNVAEFMWYLLTGILVTSVSYNYIVNSGCKQSVEEMEKRHEEYLESEEKMDKAKKEKSSTKTVYKSYD